MTNAAEFKKILASDETKMKEYFEHVRKLTDEGMEKRMQHLKRRL